MLYYIDMCVFRCLFQVMLFFSFKWFCRSNHMISVYLWYAILSVFWYLYTYIHYVLLGRTIWVSLRWIHHTCITFLICTFAWSGPWSPTENARNQAVIINTNKNQLETFQTIKRTGQTCLKKNFLEFSGQPGHRHMFTRKTILFTRKSKISNTKRGQNVDA